MYEDQLAVKAACVAAAGEQDAHIFGGCALFEGEFALFECLRLRAGTAEHDVRILRTDIPEMGTGAKGFREGRGIISMC